MIYILTGIYLMGNKCLGTVPTGFGTMFLHPSFPATSTPPLPARTLWFSNGCVILIFTFLFNANFTCSSAVLDHPISFFSSLTIFSHGWTAFIIVCTRGFISRAIQFVDSYDIQRTEAIPLSNSCGTPFQYLNRFQSIPLAFGKCFCMIMHNGSNVVFKALIVT